MIFVTVGTQKFQFNRLIRKLDDLKGNNVISDNIIAQIGYSTYTPKNFQSFKVLDFNNMSNIYNDSEIVITHGGSGSIIQALKLRKKVIAVPRLMEYGEHVDNHQFEICQALEKKGYICVARDIGKLAELINFTKNSEFEIYQTSNLNLVNEIKEYIKYNNS
ncbi:glycosyltransferase family 28 [Metabacillus idriensis]|uniref:PssE/Cps14G family polysaccharide biosynthesis glycosyltransferase n=1 Tax=Metabacillus idriensis TaxID=324768 RepID=UPI00203A7C3F|nr:PssE/Cps14G family polysaccharide biosynthesis glycosyltransferase [Metabacillus idriensis]MCM3597515.1 glycosyltransferase family 28 [Metabacillus idriensis]